MKRRMGTDWVGQRLHPGEEEGKYAEYHLALCAHYVADLTQPLHNIEYSSFNKRYHKAVGGVFNDEGMENLDKIVPWPAYAGIVDLTFSTRDQIA